jgi:hypothetical protein
MMSKKNLQKIVGLSIILMMVGITGSASCSAVPQSPTVLTITSAKGGFGKVSVTVQNIGNSTAENITMIISVTGGLFSRVNLTKICSGCGNCSNSIEPNATKTESTSEGGRIIGFGPCLISASAEASNAARVNKTFNGFVLGFLVILSK